MLRRYTCTRLNPTRTQVDVQPSDFLTIALLIVLEGLLSVDNALVLALLVMGLPKREQKQALRYGILGAFGFRILATLFAAYMIRVAWVKLVGGLYLLYLAYKHFFAGGDPTEVRRVPPAKPWLGLTAFWATVVKVELTDIVFAIDSILVAVAMSPKMWVVITGGLLGIAAMRMVTGQLVRIVERYPALVDGAFIIIAWVGLKLLAEWAHSMGYLHFEVPKWISLGLIILIFLVSFWYARKHPATPRPDEDAYDLLTDE
jgi:YkoY family integral membrane protein